MNQNFSDSSINSNCSRWNSAILRQYIVLFPSSRSLAIVLSYNEEVNLKVSLNIFLDSPFPLVEITISLSCHSLMRRSIRNFNIPPPGTPRAFDCASCPGRREFERCVERVGNLNRIYLLFWRKTLVSFFGFCRVWWIYKIEFRLC